MSDTQNIGHDLVIEWRSPADGVVTIDGLSKTDLMALARELGRLAARRDLERAAGLTAAQKDGKVGRVEPPGPASAEP